MPFFMSGATKLHHEIWGAEDNEAGPWITLVNGHTRPLNDFRMMGKHLVQHGARVLAMDNRGAGETVASGPFTLKDMAADVQRLWTHLSITETALLGISMGGLISQLVARDSTGARVTRLILVSTAPRASAIVRDTQPWTSDLAANERKLSVYFTPDFATRNAALVKSMAKQITKGVESGDFAERSRQQLAAVESFDATPFLGELTMPSLVVHGEHDRVIPLEAAHELTASLPNAAILVLRGAGHLLLAERPKELYDAVRGFALASE